MLNLELMRYAFGTDSTLGRLYVSGGERTFYCYTLEDQVRAKGAAKVKHETAIPAGTYQIKLRAEGGMHGEYKERFPAWHRGMLHLQDVPDFTWIYLHIGFREKHTSGCILVGEVPVVLPGGEFELVGSTSEPAYVRLYQRILEALDDGEKVAIHIYDVREALAA